MEIDHEIIPGASLRAWLAGMALPGLLNDVAFPEDLKQARAHKMAELAVIISDALIAELEKDA